MVEAVIGRNAISLALRSPLWIRRKLEQVEFLDSSTVRRTMRLDIDLAGLDGWRDEQGERDLDLWPQWRGGLLVPLAILPRNFYTPIEIYSSSGELMPRLTKPEERGFVEKGLLDLASQRVPGPPSAVLERLTHDIVHEAPHRNIEEYLGSRSAGNVFLDGDGLFDAAAILNTQYLLLTLIPDGIDRQVVTYSVIARLEGGNADKQWIRRLTQTAAEALVPKPSITVQIELGDTPSGSESYHIQATNPYDLVFTDSRLEFKRPRREGLNQEFDLDRLPNLGHVHLSGSRRVTECKYIATLCHVSTGLIRSAPLSTLLTTVILTAGSVWVTKLPTHDTGKADTQVGAAILLIIPALIGTLLAAPKSHTLTARVLFKTRVMLFTTSLAPIFPATAVALRCQGTAHLVAWITSATIAILGTLYLSVQYLFAQKWTQARSRRLRE